MSIDSGTLTSVGQLADLAREKGILQLQVGNISMALGALPTEQVDADDEQPADLGTPSGGDATGDDDMRFAHSRMRAPNLREMRKS
jgi:hypothetical protein